MRMIATGLSGFYSRNPEATKNSLREELGIFQEMDRSALIGIAGNGHQTRGIIL